MKRALLPFLLLFATAILFAGNLTFKLSHSYNGFDILFSNNAEVNTIIPELRDGGFFRFCIINTAGLNLSKRPPLKSSLDFNPPKGAITIQGKTIEGLHFEKTLESIPSEDFPVYLFGFFKTLINKKEGFDFFGPILVSLDKTEVKHNYSFLIGDLPSKIQSQFEMEFKHFQHQGSK